MKSIRKMYVAALAAAAGMIGVGSASTAQAEQPPRVSIASINLRGPACPPGTATVDLLRGNTAFVITYNEFNVEAGPDVPLPESSKHCVAIVGLDYPAGWTWAVSSIVYRGNMILGDAVSGRLRTRLSFPGSPSVSKEVRQSGPFLGDFELPARYETQVWAPCGGGRLPMTMTATAQVDNTRSRSRSGLVTVEQQDGTFDMICNIQWRRC